MVASRTGARGGPSGIAGGDGMTSDAYQVLEAIDRGSVDQLSDHGHWVEAMKTIRWVVQTRLGLALTSEGRGALDEMKLRFGDRLHAAE